MRKYLLFAAAFTAICLSASAEKINGTKISGNSTIAGVITDSKTGKGIEGIAVSDGYSYTRTDKHGVYQMAASPKCRVITYVTPSEFKIAQNADGSPAFFAYRDKSKKLDRHDFSLEKMASPEKEFTLFALSDPQCQTDFHVSRFLKEAVPGIERAANEEIAGGMSVYGVGLGDIIYDNLSIWEPMAENFKSFKTSNGRMPVFNVPGNHDHYNVSESDYDALNNYVKWFGPTEYSFDRGDAHIICMDDIVFDVLSGRQPEADEITRLMNSLHWNPRDRVVCVRLREQRDEGSAILDHALHSGLFQAFPRGYIMFNEREQCVLLNLTLDPMSLAMIRHTLAPLCRDYCLYAGMSSPVDGLQEWHVAWVEAQQALNRAYELRGDKWIMLFSDCIPALLLNSLQPPLRPRHVIAPELTVLREYDAAHDTQYFDTLRVFLLEERNIPRASERLIIHRTTLLYRLRKIESLVTLNLDDPWRRLYLMLSLKILDGTQA